MGKKENNGIVDFLNALSRRLCGYTPFRSDDPAKLAAETQRGKIEFHDRYWKHISPEAKDFVKLCLTVDPHKRITADEAIKHAWLVEHKEDAQASHDISIGLRENYRKRWKSAINAVRASTKFRTFAALAADGKSTSGGEASTTSSSSSISASSSIGDNSASPNGGVTKVEDGKIKATSSRHPEVVPTRSELYSDESQDQDDDDDDDDWATGDEGSVNDGHGNKRRSVRSSHSRKKSGAVDDQDDAAAAAASPSSPHSSSLKDKVDGLAHKVQQAL